MAIDPETLAESRLELTAMFGDQPGAIPASLLVEHLIAGRGHASWQVLRGAGQALLRRIAARDTARETDRAVRRAERGE